MLPNLDGVQVLMMARMMIMVSVLMQMSKMKELRKLLGEKDPDVCLTVRKLVMVSLCEIFRDIVPGYRLRLPTAQEKEQRVSL